APVVPDVALKPAADAEPASREKATGTPDRPTPATSTTLKVTSAELGQPVPARQIVGLSTETNSMPVVAGAATTRSADCCELEPAICALIRSVVPQPLSL